MDQNIQEMERNLERLIIGMNNLAANVNRIAEQQAVPNRAEQQLDRANNLQNNDLIRLGTSVRYNIPTFSYQKRDRPMKFLRELDIYIRTVGDDEQNIKFIVNQALTDTVREWWQLVESNTRTYEEFKQRFKARFWNGEMQRNVRQRFEFGAYEKNTRLSRVEYAIRACNDARDVNPGMSEREIVRVLARHFDQEVRTAKIVRSIQTIDGFIEILEQFDKLGQSGMYWTKREENSSGNRENNRTSTEIENENWRSNRSAPLTEKNIQPRNNTNQGNNRNTGHRRINAIEMEATEEEIEET